MSPVHGRTDSPGLEGGGSIMGLFDSFKRRPTSGDDLRETLFQAAERRDWQALADLCRQHQQEIRDSFPGWRTLPEALRSDPVGQNRYAQGLLAVAQLFEQAGDRSLISSLIGDESDNPLLAWERDLTAAQSLIGSGRPRQAVELLESTLARNAGLLGSGVDSYLPRTHGLLGIAWFRAGDTAKGVEFTEKARSRCEELGDAEGFTVYTTNLRQMKEGSSIILRDADGRALSPEDLRDATGTVRYEIIGNVSVTPEATALHEAGRQAGSKGDYPKALADLGRASQLAPEWPYPVYDMAFTYLLMKDFETATAYFRKTIDLAPRGFFTAITALDTLLREQRGDLPVGTYLAYSSLEWVADRRKQAEGVRALTEGLPTFAPAWRDFAILVEDDEEKLAAIEKGMAAIPDAETKGSLQINKALILNRRGDRDGAVRLLRELAVDPASTLATEHLAKFVLANTAGK